VQSGMERKFSPELLDMETELRIAATDSSHPKRFEIACMRAFAMLGFESEQIGGPADTDVLLTGQIGTSDTYAVCVDAKTSASGSVDSNIKFVPLKNHRDKHGAKYSVVIGARFGKSTQEGDYAEGNAVVFMGVDMLCKLLEKHEATPLSTGEYRRLFEMSGKVEDDDLESLFAASERKQRILKYLLRALSSPIVINQYGGFCNIDEIKILMIQSGLSAANGGSKLEDEITDVISFLSHPMINVIEENRERYRLTGSLRDLTMKLSCYTDARIEL
ncbi:MAG: hypothetical protein IKV48_00315, partial [Eggerthellaceae bacterium]|nr:hypothetical protein [Eggerthellaceae bacterium]